jgi:hypothetical protein
MLRVLMASSGQQRWMRCGAACRSAAAGGQCPRLCKTLRALQAGVDAGVSRGLPRVCSFFLLGVHEDNQSGTSRRPPREPQREPQPRPQDCVARTRRAYLLPQLRYRKQPSNQTGGPVSRDKHPVGGAGAVRHSSARSWRGRAAALGEREQWRTRPACQSSRLRGVSTSLEEAAGTAPPRIRSAQNFEASSRPKRWPAPVS